MTRVLKIAAAQLGPISLKDNREVVVPRLVALLERAHSERCNLVVYPELALTTFFPRYFFESDGEIEPFFEKEIPGPATKPLFEAAVQWGIGFYLGYAETAWEGGRKVRYNSSILTDRSGAIIGKYRKVHLPGREDYEPNQSRHNFEKRYFNVGNLGFPVWRNMGGIMGMCICNDRRWPETFRMMGLQGVELVMVGYNTGTFGTHDNEPEALRMMQNHICMQTAAYQNSTWVVGTAKAGVEDGAPLMGGSAIIAPSGAIVAQATTLDDELVVAECDLDDCNLGKATLFNFAAHRRPEHYRRIVDQVGVMLPPE